MLCSSKVMEINDFQWKSKMATKMAAKMAANDPHGTRIWFGNKKKIQDDHQRPHGTSFWFAVASTAVFVLKYLYMLIFL